jgi:ribonuclease BN (tRNA processing enzyme)
MRRSASAALSAGIAVTLVSAVPLEAQLRCSHDGVSVQVLGSGGPRAGTERASSSYLVWIDGESRVMIDVGGGAFVRFGEAGASLAALDLLAISHFHPDHASDLAALLWLSDQARQVPLPIVGPSGNDAFPSLDELLHQLFDPGEGAFRILSGTVGGPGRGVLLEPTTVAVDGHDPVTVLERPGLTVRALSVPHTNVPALAYRVETRGVSVVFSSDQTGEDPRFVDFTRGADVLVMHMAIPVGAQGAVLAIHATPARVGEVARDAGVTHLVLSHLVPTQEQLDEGIAAVRERYRGPVDAARDLDCFRVG